jgi:hypothetical protein
MSCDTFIGECETLDDLDGIDRLACDHDQVCPATPEQKHAAVIGLKLKSFTAQEGL